MNNNIKECQFKKSCVSKCIECDIYDSEMEDCNECYSVCSLAEEYEDCIDYEIMECIYM